MISFNNIGNLGRLANQMFQYASLKGIARNRGYEFTIPPEDVFGQNDPLVKTSPLNIYNVFENISNNKIEIVRNPMLQERMHEFDEELFRSCPDNVDLFGYFQSPKYFQHIEDEIKNDSPELAEHSDAAVVNVTLPFVIFVLFGARRVPSPAVASFV